MLLHFTTYCFKSKESFVKDLHLRFRWIVPFQEYDKAEETDRRLKRLHGRDRGGET